MSEFRFLLGDLARAFPEPAIWANTGLPIIGRFRIDPFDVPLAGTNAGIGEVQTWFYCERAVIPGVLVPDIGHVLIIRGRGWEIVEAGEDDLGELSYRLIKYAAAPAAVLAGAESGGDTNAAPVECPNGEIGRRPGRPSRRDEIVCAFAAVVEAGAIDPGEPLTHVFPAVRQRITGTTAPSSGLGDKTLRKTLTPLVEAKRNGQK
jgi:hypothetical protein